MRKTVLVSFLALIALSACNTVKGFGHDVQDGGEVITQGAQEAQQGM